jgi:hypothetical protein
MLPILCRSARTLRLPGNNLNANSPRRRMSFDELSTELRRPRR